MTTLSGRVAIVTGGGRGIGKGISLALASAGCNVAVNYVSREADALATAEAIPMGRFGQVDECADVAVMLAGNAYMTGQTIGVNGGMFM